MRFAYQEIKFCLASVLRAFEVRPQPPKPKSRFDFFSQMAVTNVPVVLSKRKR